MGEEKPLCSQGSNAAGLHTVVTPRPPNVTSFCAHAWGCTTEPCEADEKSSVGLTHFFFFKSQIYMPLKKLKQLTIMILMGTL